MVRPVPEKPGPDQESVWDFPRPAIAEATKSHLRVEFSGRCIAETSNGVRTLETSHPPTYYFPPNAIMVSALKPSDHSSFCEWKGEASYFHVELAGKRVENAAWSYPTPTSSFVILRDHVAFYPSLMEGCFVNNERVQPQPGGFYGGWVTSHFSGPFKGGPGSYGW